MATVLKNENKIVNICILRQKVKMSPCFCSTVPSNVESNTDQITKWRSEQLKKFRVVKFIIFKKICMTYCFLAFLMLYTIGTWIKIKKGFYYTNNQ